MKKLFITGCLGASIFIGSNSYALDFDMESVKKSYARPAEIKFPSENHYSDAKYNLGKVLFFETRISASKVTSCATCHNPSFSWADGLSKSIGYKHQILGRKTPTLLNLAWDPAMFWDGRADDLESQALGPIQNTKEMNMKLEAVEKWLASVPEYVQMFKEAFPEDGGKVSRENLAKAIAIFERKIVSSDAPFDKWLAGDETAISESAKRGFVVFNTRANCNKCHRGWRFADGGFHDIGLKSTDLGRGAIDRDIEVLQHAFKTPGLRNIDRRGPYMHDGSIATLKGVVDHYDSGFVNRPSLSSDVFRLNLTDIDKEDLVNFMKTLTSNDELTTIPNLPIENNF